MATTSKQMFNGAASTSSTTLYTAPSSSGAVAVVTNIIVANTAGTAATYTLNLGGNAIATTVTVGAYDSAIIDLKQVLTASQTITGLASATTVNFFISGVEIV